MSLKNNRRVLDLNTAVSLKFAKNDVFHFLLSNKVVYSNFLLGFNELKMVNTYYIQKDLIKSLLNFDS